MGAQSSSSRSVSEFTFVEALFAIIIAWTLVSLWVRFIDNLAYRTLKLNPVSTFHALIVALTVTAIFIVFTYSAESAVSNIIIGTTESSPGDAEDPNGGGGSTNMLMSQQGNILTRNVANKLSMGTKINASGGKVLIPGSMIDLHALQKKQNTNNENDFEILNSIINTSKNGSTRDFRGRFDNTFRGFDSGNDRQEQYGRTPSISSGFSIKYDRPAIQRTVPEILSRDV